MDNLLAHSKRQRILVSSTGINDLSKKIAVGGDEMLLNAINQMNVKSRAYVFVDQSYQKDFGQLELLTLSEDRKLPRFYFRGAITQLDSNTINDKINVSVKFQNASNPPTNSGGALQSLTPKAGQSVSIVSVDLHLVSYPDKTVLPGGSVANSMIVISKNFGMGGTGLINLTGYNMSISFSRVESIGQAVRNLIELGVIELLGRYANVPYQKCLNIEPTNEIMQNTKRSAFIRTAKSKSIKETQRMLSKLGYFTGPATGQMDIDTHAALAKFQADEDLIATGNLNFDTYERMVQKFNGYPVNGRSRATHAKMVSNRPKPAGGATLRMSSGNGLTLVSSKRNFHINDNFSVKLNVKTSGFLYCFYQSGTGGVIQILPQNPNVRLQVPSGYARILPAAHDGFSLKFETPKNAQRILCTIQKATLNAVSPFDGKFKPLRSLPVKRLENIPTKFNAFGGLTDWAMVSKRPKP
ncbi:MAG: peptidoglycan-binding protein [Rhodobacterales bacterium]